MARSNFPDHLARLERVHDYVIGVVYYFFVSSFAYYFFWGSPNIPNWIGGTGKGNYFCANWPLTAVPFPHLDWYYCIQMGYHSHNLILQVFFRMHKKTYIEMSLHHTLTLLLIFYSYFINMHNMGVTVMMVHDIGDFVMNLAKVLRDLDLVKGWQLDFWYAGIVFTFGYFRTFVASVTYLVPGIGMLCPTEWGLTGMLMKHPMPYFDYTDTWGMSFMCVATLTLAGLNFYWVILIIGVGMKKRNNDGYIAEFQGEKASLEGNAIKDIKKSK